MKYYFVYILECSDNSYYTGVTNNMERKLHEHQSSENPQAFTYNKRPVKLVFCEEYQDIVQAIAFEKQIKGWTRKKKEAIIEGNWHKLKALSLCRNNSNYINK